MGTPGPREFRTSQVAANHFAVAMVMPLGEVAAGASKAHEAVLFAGPQEEEKLAALAPGLELVKDYGWLTVLSKPLFWLLARLHGMLANWGWAIVALVVLLDVYKRQSLTSGKSSLGRVCSVKRLLPPCSVSLLAALLSVTT